MTLLDLLEEQGAAYVGDAYYFLSVGGCVYVETSDGLQLNVDFMANDEIYRWNGSWIFAD